MRAIWTEGKFFFLEVWQRATTDLATMFTNVFATIEIGWVSTVAAMKLIYFGFLSAFATAQNKVGNWLLDTLAKMRSTVELINIKTKAISPQEGARRLVEIEKERKNAANDIDTQFDDGQASRSSKIKGIRDKQNKDVLKISADQNAAAKVLAADQAIALAKLKVDRLAAVGASAKELADAREEFKLARAKAAEVRRGVELANEQGPVPGFGGDASLATKSQSFSTFSSAAGIAAGFGGTSDARDEIARKQLDETRKQKDIQQKQLDLIDKNMQMLERFTAAMSHA
jgi:hypothetical protein